MYASIVCDYQPLYKDRKILLLNVFVGDNCLKNMLENPITFNDIFTVNEIAAQQYYFRMQNNLE